MITIMRITEFSIDLLPQTEPTISIAAIAPTADRMEATARLGAIVPRGLAAPNAAGIIRQACARLIDQLQPSSRMTIRSVIADDIIMGPQQAARLGLIASELLANAVVHAHPTGVIGEIELKCARDVAGGVLLEINDDGIGLPEAFNPGTDCGSGLRVVRAVAEDLGASVRFNSGGCGLSVEVRVPSQA